MARKFSKLMTDTKLQEGQSTPSINTQKSLLRHMMFKLQKTKAKEVLKKLGLCEGGTPSTQSNKDKNYLELLIRNHARNRVK